MLLAALLCYAGFSALCLAMDRHHQELLGGKASRARRGWLRVGATGLFGLALACLVASVGWALGLARALAVAMASAGLLVWLLPYWPRVALGLAALAMPGALVLAVVGV